MRLKRKKIKEQNSMTMTVNEEFMKELNRQIKRRPEAEANYRRLYLNGRRLLPKKKTKINNY